MSITITSPVYRIDGKTGIAELMKHQNTGELKFRQYFETAFFDTLVFSSLSDMIVFLDRHYSRSHYVCEDKIIYLEGTIYAKYFGTIEGDN